MKCLSFASQQLKLLILVVVLCMGGLRATNAQQTSPGATQNLPEPSTGEIRERISSIIRETIKRGEGTVDGVKIWTRVPPDDKVEEIKAYGDKAVPVLEEYIWAQNVPEGDLALRFLGLLGGSRIVGPLRRVAEKSPSPDRRQMALRWLTQAPWNLASPIIRNSAETDPDPKVRDIARDLLATYSPQRQ